VRAIDQQITRGFFDAAIMNGVLGYGVDDLEGAGAAIRALATVVRPNGFVIIGWNPGRVINYRELAVVRRFLVPAQLGGLPTSVEFRPDSVQSYPHRYDLYRVR
jgi:hypothetical protein